MMKRSTWKRCGVGWVSLLALLLVLSFSCSKSSEDSRPDPNPTPSGSNEDSGPSEDSSKNEESEEESNENRPKADLFQADPAIIKEGKTFYLYGTNDKDPNLGFEVYTSEDLINWEGPVGARNGLALSKDENYGNHSFWASQVWKSGEVYYMAYTAEEHIAISSSTKLTGPFIQSPQNRLFTSGKKQIDPFVYIEEDKKYLFYVDNTNGNKIYVTELNDNFKSVKDQEGTKCIEYSQPWEKEGTPVANVNEGPTVIKHKGYYYLLYSANHFENPNYAVGYAVSESVTGPWTKYEGNPILSNEDIDWPGVGHGDLIFDENGELYTDEEGNMVYVFHMHNRKTGSLVVPRRTAIIKMNFESREDGPDLLKIIPDSYERIRVYL